MIYSKLQYNQVLLLTISCVLVLSFSLPAFGQTAPATPQYLSATAVSSSQINLSWPASSGSPTGYKIEVKIVTAGSWTVLNQNTGTVTSYTHTGVQDRKSVV